MKQIKIMIDTILIGKRRAKEDVKVIIISKAI